ncbi:MAG: sensor histidine kinase, partial [Bacillota bacterium]|nr:sensor histidine kinase [Bacillota bacterium]
MFNNVIPQKKHSEKFILKKKLSELLLRSFSFLNMFSLKSRIMASFLILSIIPLIIISTTSYIKTKSTITKLSVSNSQQVVNQIAENINFATKYYDDLMTQFIIDPKVQDALWKAINLKDGNIQKRQSLDLLESSFSDFLSLKGSEISTLGICTSGGLSFGVFPQEISPASFFDTKGYEKTILKKIVSANGSPVWISPKEWLENFNKRLTRIVICRSLNNIDTTSTIVLVMELKSYTLNDLCNSKGAGKGSKNDVSFIIDDEGYVVSHKTENEVGKKIDSYFKDNDSIEKIRNAGSNLVGFNSSFNNVNSYVSVTEVNMNKNWKLVNVLDNSYLFREANNTIRFTILVWVICALIGIIISLAISLNVSTAVLTVAKGLSDIAEGGEACLNKSLEVTSNDEIKDLVIAFNKIQELEKENIKSIKKNQSELIETLNTLQTAQAQLVQSEKMASLGSLVAGISHEINTPIGISVTASSHLMQKTEEFIKVLQSKTLRRSDLNAFSLTIVETTEILLKNLYRASELIKSFKQVAVDQTHEEKRELNVKQYLNEIILSLTPSLKNRKIGVQINCAEDIQIKAYAGSISQIITNLIMNSLLHAFEPDDKGSIVINTYYKDNHKLVLDFKDDGKGMEKDTLSKIFDPFFTTKRGKGGTGLGLHLVYNIVYQKLGGTIVCSSEPGKGANF